MNKCNWCDYTGVFESWIDFHNMRRWQSCPICGHIRKPVKPEEPPTSSRSSGAVGSIAETKHKFAVDSFGNDEARLVSMLTRRGFHSLSEINAYKTGINDVFSWLEKQ